MSSPRPLQAGADAPNAPPASSVARTDLFPGYTDEREVSPGTYVLRPRGGGDMSVARALPIRNFGDVRQLQRYTNNLDRAAALEMAGVVRVRARGTAADGRPFQVRDHVHGVPLDVFARGRAFSQAAPPPLPMLVRLFVRAAAVLHEAHLVGVVHGGIKASNLLVDAGGSPQFADFGLHLTDASDPAADVAALGRLMFDTLRERPTPPDALLAAIVTRAMSPSPLDGYSSAGALAEDLDAYLSGKTPAGQPIGVRAGVRHWFERHLQRPAAAIAVGAVAGLLAGAYLVVATWRLSIADLPAHGFAALPHAAYASIPLRAWLIAAGFATFQLGGLACCLAKPRSVRGALAASLLTGLTAGFIAWVAGAGGYVNSFIVLGRAEPTRFLAEEFPRRVPFTAFSSFDIADPDAQDRLLERYPELADVPEAERAGVIHESVLTNLKATGFVTGWLAPLLPLGVALGMALIGGWAYERARSLWKRRIGRVYAYLELSFMLQAAILLGVAVLLRQLAGLAPAGPWLIPASVFVLGACLVWSVLYGVPLSARVAACAGGLVFFARAAGHPLPLWAEAPAYAATLALLAWSIQPHARPTERAT